jgi:hypothetical protein
MKSNPPWRVVLILLFGTFLLPVSYSQGKTQFSMLQHLLWYATMNVTVPQYKGGFLRARILFKCLSRIPKLNA